MYFYINTVYKQHTFARLHRYSSSLEAESLTMCCCVYLVMSLLTACYIKLLFSPLNHLLSRSVSPK